ncbi:MAG: hypothetical protein UX06_C0050G0006 [Candidatus Giovannonibacteria bacterium GW2011_GWA2_45_21]|uniref:Uncharacterized protein n=1 Tax=Candidatus Giovannonibacteria bacterium GW2011_GWA2_45_21 TaxID=1618649 RepID=A0A0G1Q2D2_9BACT|nr:MAG: hypothetical protein UX06_C0050G0006 [Candidatus Giovannonibacteria bacterium GW2011_GWA2_45_21]
MAIPRFPLIMRFVPESKVSVPEVYESEASERSKEAPSIESRVVGVNCNAGASANSESSRALGKAGSVKRRIGSAV